MRIGIIGYGKMGRLIEKIAESRGHQVVCIVSRTDNLQLLKTKRVELAFEFSVPEKAFTNIAFCLQHGIAVVSGTTGWLDLKKQADAICAEEGGRFFHATNFSIGVNLFLKANAYLAKIIAQYEQYDVQISEVHHIHKKDAPSGTAITTAKSILDNLPRKKEWVRANNQKPYAQDQIPIHAHREAEVIGVHEVLYSSESDFISLKHQALDRSIYAHGAVLAAEWLQERQGVFGMADMLAGVFDSNY